MDTHGVIGKCGDRCHQGGKGGSTKAAQKFKSAYHKKASKT